MFPLELFDEVIGHSQREDLASLSTINTHFRRRTQAIIFKEIRIVAGPLCILRKTTQTIGDSENVGRILPDTFTDVLREFQEISGEACTHIRKITLSGLSSTKKLTTGHGIDPHLSLCTLKKFISRLHRLEQLSISDVLWSPCMIQQLDPMNHHCAAGSVSLSLQTLSLSHVAHARSSDSIFDVLQVITHCHTLLLSQVHWRNTPPFGLTIRTSRPDIRRLVVRFPASFSLGHQLNLRFPILTSLTHLEVHNVAAESYDAVWELLDYNSRSLQHLDLNVDSTSFSVENWTGLPTLMCSKLQEVSITLDLCNHTAHDGCAGTDTLQTFLETLSESVEILRITLMDSAMQDESLRRVRRMLDWSAIISQLSTLSRLRTIYFTTVNIDDAGDVNSRHRTWECSIQKDLQPIDRKISIHAPQELEELTDIQSSYFHDE
ncbi:hypothetical protein NM688_g575 [Phlebia brevispora]|uniref:Uncharacterized protein n=1 Tax=Phlebia brevispora TaxID=194682 RepID=A0ACC1TDU2_9APHY|nr:hypothetical protein NM688_g575 [Phlebia brevispora]